MWVNETVLSRGVCVTLKNRFISESASFSTSRITELWSVIRVPALNREGTAAKCLTSLSRLSVEAEVVSLSDPWGRSSDQWQTKSRKKLVGDAVATFELRNSSSCRELPAERRGVMADEDNYPSCSLDAWHLVVV